ncbi:hypothetical protein LBRM_15_0630 [Leishmania braziliensis MHOM/BR/75/M2904]|uniref:Uncharacterized protein n=2 Tax=Leishmania braziliensis TaxID=5660 RepID=A4H832_LEIBR|nr:hypothetical protein LBRM_15_0630 [Leishmania braziliensis MHOM/BR/75/M2904]KAI5691963.1 hypothetical protein MNV84_02045 [Leishmania braziliensis]CAJ2469351.1 unnamed protein product [Leishmania braziliensis]CAM42080.1 hypothetical protein LBRM_15_0630 [Leishmania braziliensis MHOM/BR/75/M2904]SYZ64196.1 hypothetical_protein [Leishmania braziliensis MHOM/BR/75/M2904]
MLRSPKERWRAQESLPTPHLGRQQVLPSWTHDRPPQQQEQQQRSKEQETRASRTVEGNAPPSNDGNGAGGRAPRHRRSRVGRHRHAGPSFRSAGVVAYSSSSSSFSSSSRRTGGSGSCGDGGHSRCTAQLASPQTLIDAGKLFKLSPNDRLTHDPDTASARKLQQTLLPTTPTTSNYQQRHTGPGAATAASTTQAMRTASPSFPSSASQPRSSRQEGRRTRSAKRRWSTSGVHYESAQDDAELDKDEGNRGHGGSAAHCTSRHARQAAQLLPQDAGKEAFAEVMDGSAAETSFIHRETCGSMSSVLGKDSAQAHSVTQRNEKSVRHHRQHNPQHYVPALVVLEKATPRRANDRACNSARNSNGSDSVLPDTAEVDYSCSGRRPSNARSVASLESRAAFKASLAGAELQRQRGAALHTRAMQAAWTSYMHRCGHLSSPERYDRQRATLLQDAPPQITYAHDGMSVQQRPRQTAAAEPSVNSKVPGPLTNALALAKEVLLLRCSLLMTYTLLAAATVEGSGDGGVNAIAKRSWQYAAQHYARWTTAAEQRAHWQRGGQAGASDEKRTEHQHPNRCSAALYLRGSTPWPALETRLVAAVQGAVEELLLNEAAATAPKKLPSPQLLRESPPHDVDGLPSVWYPPHRGDDGDGPLSGMLWVWFSGGDDSHVEDDVAGTSLSSSDDNDLKDNDGSGTERPSLSADSAAMRCRRQHERRKRGGLSSLFRRSHRRFGERRRPPTVVRSLRGVWHRCFVVADDSGVCVYPTECDYANFATERLLMSVPYASLAYLVPDFSAAAVAAFDNVGMEQDEKEWGSSNGYARPSARPGRGNYPLQHCGSMEAVHVATIAAVTSELATGKAYTYFGFLHCQRDGVARRAAATAEAFSTVEHDAFHQEQEEARSFRFAPWRVSGDRGKSYAHRLHAPLLLRTELRATRAEWVHFFAAKFNRHLYALLFPTACAAMAKKKPLRHRPGNAEVAVVVVPETDADDVVSNNVQQEKHQRHRHRRRRTRNSSASLEQQQQQHIHNRAVPPSSSPHRGRRHRHHPSQRLSQVEEAQDEVGIGAAASHRLSSSSFSSTQVEDSRDYDVLAAAVVREKALEPLSSQLSATAAARHDQRPGASEPWWETISALRHTIAQRDQRLLDQEKEMADMAKALRQYAQREHSLKEEHDRLQAALRGADDRLANLITAERSQQPEVQRLCRAAGARVPPQDGCTALGSEDAIHISHPSSTLSPERKRHAICPDAFDQSRSPHAPSPTVPDAQQQQQRGLESLQAQLEELQRRYVADAVSWRAERTALEGRCLVAEEKLKHLRSGASQQLRSPTHQVMHDAENHRHEVWSGKRASVDARASGLMLNNELATTENNDTAGAYLSRATNERSQSGDAAPAITVLSAPDSAFASLLLTFKPSRGRAGARAGDCVDGALIVDEASARLLFSGPTANQRGRRWELRHHDTDALLRIQLELLSRVPGDVRAVVRSTSRRRRPAASSLSALASDPRASSPSLHSPASNTTPRRSTGSAAGASLSPPPSLQPHWSIHAYDQRDSHHYSPPDISAASASCLAGSTQLRTHLSSLLRTVNVAPRHTRASLLRQAAIGQKIQVREAEERGSAVLSQSRERVF